MIGEIGSLVQDGRQIGGFLNWTIDLIFVRAGDSHKAVSIKSTADKFWLISCPSQSEIMALYYQLVKDKLVLITQSRVMVSLKGETDKLIDKKLEMRWIT